MENWLHGKVHHLQQQSQFRPATILLIQLLNIHFNANSHVS
jgi:hypothetical protein